MLTAKINETGMFGEGDDEEGVLFDDYGDDQDIEIEDDVSDTIEPHPRIQEIDIPSYFSCFLGAVVTQLTTETLSLGTVFRLR